MSYLDAYHAWLNSPALSAAEKAELASIQGDDARRSNPAFLISFPSAPPACAAPWAWVCTA